MTNKEAIEILKRDRDLYRFNPMTGERVPMSKDCEDSANALDLAIAALEKQGTPAADVVEVRKAKWVATDKYMVDKCSNCQFEMDWNDVPLWLVDMPHFKDSCPNCGAKMDGGVNDDKAD